MRINTIGDWLDIKSNDLGELMDIAFSIDEPPVRSYALYELCNRFAHKDCYNDVLSIIDSNLLIEPHLSQSKLIIVESLLDGCCGLDSALETADSIIVNSVKIDANLAITWWLLINKRDQKAISLLNESKGLALSEQDPILRDALIHSVERFIEANFLRFRILP